MVARRGLPRWKYYIAIRAGFEPKALRNEVTCFTTTLRRHTGSQDAVPEWDWFRTIRVFNTSVFSCFQFLLNLMLCSKLNDNGSMIDFILNSPAPIYTACKLARLYRLESTKEKDKSSELIEIGSYCEQVGLDLLHLSTTFDTEDVLNAVDDARQPLIDILIDAELKNCVAHANVQGYLSDVWRGDNPLFDGWRTIVLFLLCFLIPPLWAFFALPYNKYSRVPTLRFICYVISHVYLIALLILVAVIPWDRSYEELFPTPYEWILLIWLSGMLISQISEPQSRSGLGLFPPLILGLSTIAILMHVFAIFTIGQSREELMYSRDQVLGLALLLCVVQCMEFLSLHHLFGPWSIIIRSLIQDLLRFLVILMIFIIGFALQLTVVYKPVYNLKHVKVPTDTVPIPKRQGPLIVFEHLFFAMFGLTGKSDIDAFDANTNPPATKYLALMIFGFYEIIIIIVLINLLIAMMSNTYTRLEERSDIEWKFGRAKIIRNMTKTVATPVPLNIITTLVAIFRIMFKTNCCCCRTDVAKICDEMENQVTEMPMESFVSLDRSTMVEEGSGPKRLADVVNWGDVVARYMENKGLHIDDVEDEIDKLESGNKGNRRTLTLRSKKTANGHVATWVISSYGAEVSNSVSMQNYFFDFYRHPRCAPRKPLSFSGIPCVIKCDYFHEAIKFLSWSCPWTAKWVLFSFVTRIRSIQHQTTRTVASLCFIGKTSEYRERPGV